MKILLTGATGFIGKHLCNLLGKSGYNIYYLFFTTGSTPEIHDSYGSKSSTILATDIDVLIHLAGAAHRKFTDKEASEINYSLTKKALDFALLHRINRFFFLSSTNIYKETNNKVGLSSRIVFKDLPNTMKSKLDAENYILTEAKNNNVEIVIVRSPLVYGEGVKANFASLMNFVAKGLPLPFRAIKSNKRSLVSVYNLVDLIKVCIEHPKAANQVFLASDDNDLSTAEMVALMARVQGKRNIAFPVPVWCFKLAGKLLNKNDVIDRLTGSLQLDITHTKNTLNWTPPYPVEHGFKLAAKKPS